MESLKAVAGNGFFNFTLDPVIEYCRPWIRPKGADKEKLFCTVGKAQFCNFCWIDKINFIKCLLGPRLFDGGSQAAKYIVDLHAGKTIVQPVEIGQVLDQFGVCHRKRAPDQCYQMFIMIIV
jgi:hypothetical protein